jgi:hypothetical protein
MDPEVAILETFADALDAASASIRHSASRMAARLSPDPDMPSGDGMVARARALHPALGPRQAQAIKELEDAWPDSRTTGLLAASMAYDQPNVYLTLKTLISLGFADKDASASPHLYRLGPRLSG